jgi:hypothetical protein
MKLAMDDIEGEEVELDEATVVVERVLEVLGAMA